MRPAPRYRSRVEHSDQSTAADATAIVDDPAASTRPGGRFRAWLRERFATPEAVYGLILYSAVIAGASDEHSDSGEVLGIALPTLLIFYLAHVFAMTLSVHGKHGFRKAVAHGVHHSSGMLYASIIPTIPLVVGAFGRMESGDSVDLALLLVSLTLGVLGYSAYAQRGAKVWVRVLGAIGTMMFGFIVFVLNYLVH